jgi:hypothetical protein
MQHVNNNIPQTQVVAADTSVGSCLVFLKSCVFCNLETI